MYINMHKPIYIYIYIYISRRIARIACEVRESSLAPVEKEGGWWGEGRQPTRVNPMFTPIHICTGIYIYIYIYIYGSRRIAWTACEAIEPSVSPREKRKKGGGRWRGGGIYRLGFN